MPSTGVDTVHLRTSPQFHLPALREWKFSKQVGHNGSLHLEQIYFVFLLHALSWHLFAFLMSISFGQWFPSWNRTSSAALETGLLFFVGGVADGLPLLAGACSFFPMFMRLLATDALKSRSRTSFPACLCRSQQFTTVYHVVNCVFDQKHATWRSESSKACNAPCPLEWTDV